jgi:hypothetical protein
MKGTIEYCDVLLDVTYTHDLYQDKHEIQVYEIYPSGSSVDIWNICEAGGLVDRIEEKIYEQLHCY